MNSLFEDLKEGLQEAIDYEKGKGKARTTAFIISPVTKYTNDEIKAIRKAIEAWELGRTHPTGPAYRLIDILKQGKENELSFVLVKTD